MANAYVGLTTLKAGIGAGISGTADDAILLSKLEAASRDIDRFCERRFYVESTTKYFDGDGTNLLLVPDLLSITTLQLDDDVDGLTWEETLSAAVPDYLLEPYNSWPKTRIRLHPMGTYAAFTAGPRTVAIAGSWGYGNGVSATPYTPNLTTTTEELDASETGVDVTDRTVLEVGDTLLIESEQMYVTAITAGAGNAGTLTVVRGVNGTTAATHTTAKAIAVYDYPSTIVEAALMQTARLYKRKDSAYSPEMGGVETGVLSVGRGLDPDVVEKLLPFVRHGLRMGSV
uniref:Putative head tail connector protein n=1 Tax=viral metagenome TaxID=1070528 RepID=A0A6M3IJ37_9ZZZZ